MATDIYREVDFAKYCATCKHENIAENKDPCCECMDYGCNIESCKPVNWEEKE